MTAIEEVHGPRGGDAAFTADTFLDYLRLSSDRWHDRKGKAFPWVFRGTGRASYDLLPSAWRSPCALDPLISHLEPVIRVDGFSISSGFLSFGPHATQAAARINAENFALLEFNDLASRLGFPGEVIRRYPGQLFHWNGNDTSLELARFAPTAQHHGVPTRLMDWTRSSIFAARFAVDSASADGEPLAVWALDFDAASSLIDTAIGVGDYNYPCRLSHVDQPSHQNPFLHAQQGMFSILINGDHYFAKNGLWPSLNKIVSDYDAFTKAPVMKKMILPHDQFDRLRALLYREGVSRASLMPTLDEVAKVTVHGWRSTLPRSLVG